MPATIAAVSTPAAPAAAGNTAPVQTSAGSGSSTKPAGDAPGADPNMGGKPAAKPAETQAEKAQRLKFKAKIDGREEEVEWDEAEAARTYQKAKHYEKTRGADQARQKAFEQQLEALTKDPVGFMRQRNIDLAELGRQEAAQQEALAKLTPEARELAEAKAEIARLGEAEATRVQEAEIAAKQAEAHALVQNTVKTLDAAIKLSGQKRSGELVKLFADVMELAEHAGEPPMSPEQIVAAGERLDAQRWGKGIKRAAADPAWRARNAPLMKELAQAVLPTLEGKELFDFVGPENARKIARHSYDLLRKNPIPMVAESTGQQPSPAANGEKPEAPQAMYSMLDRLAGG